MDLVKAVEQQQLKGGYKEVDIGDYVKVHLKIKEGNRERVQIFEGTVIARKGAGYPRPLQSEDCHMVLV